MTREPSSLPSTRTWRDIPQPAVPRAMSRGGRWRLVMAVVRGAFVASVCGLCCWAAWLVAMSLREDSRAVPAAAKSTPMKRPELRTDGVLDDVWLARALQLPKKASLMELDLEKLRARLLADDQVVTANLTRHFPDRLVVQLTERSPVARVMTEWMGQQRALLVARDGIVYAGSGYDASVIETLPWLDGVKLSPEGGRFKPIEGMDVTAELLAKARLEAEHLFANWKIVSLARLATDRKIEVRTSDGALTVFFTTNDDFFRQLVKLNYVCDQLAEAPAARATVDLTLGQDVPVTVVQLGPDGAPLPSKPAPKRAPPPRFVSTADLRLGAAAPGSSPLFALPTSQPKKTKREL